MSVIVYHKGCMDGVAAAWCFWKNHPGQDFIPGVYQSDFDPTIFTHQDVFLVDFSYPLKETKAILNVCKTLTILDHHKSCFEMLDALGEHRKLNSYYCDANSSGCMIAWKFLNGNKVPPQALLHIQDRDLWKFELEHTREVNAGLFSLDYTDFSIFDAAIKDVDYLRAVGYILVKDQGNRTRKAAGGARQVEMVWDGLNGAIWSVNCPRDLASEVGNLLCKVPFESGEMPLYVDCWSVYKETLDHSLRSVGEFDVSAVAKKHGGGGHRNAAGFKEEFYA